jgi:quercetin dioxygenase-like cupin family protein
MRTRVHETPNATMTTLASPTLNGADIAVWRVRMDAGAAGPLHDVDVDQVLTVEAGEAEIDLGGARSVVHAGETALLPAGTPRKVRAAGDSVMQALVVSRPNATASTSARGDVPLPWAA